MWTIPLHERTVTLDGCEYDDGPVRVKVQPRTFRIREYEDSQIHLRMMLAFYAGLAAGMIPMLVALYVVWPAPPIAP